MKKMNNAAGQPYGKEFWTRVFCWLYIMMMSLLSYGGQVRSCILKDEWLMASATIVMVLVAITLIVQSVMSFAKDMNEINGNANSLDHVKKSKRLNVIAWGQGLAGAVVFGIPELFLPVTFTNCFG